MFFGAKGQHYWAEPPSPTEIYLSENAADAMIQIRGMSYADLQRVDFVDKLATLGGQYPGMTDIILQAMVSSAAPTSVSTEIGRIFGRYKPFRNYHYFDSTHHILKNNIRTSIDGTFNEVQVLYFEKERYVAGSIWNLWDPDVKEHMADDYKVLSCKLDDNIPEEYIRSYRAEFPSCITEMMAKRYAQGLFARLLRDAYKGELIVLGEPTLKPYDIAYLCDSSINMTGPIEVEAVEHIINRDHGFISIITPDLCVDMNDMYSVSAFDLAGAALAQTFGFENPDVASAVTAIASPLAFLAVMGGVKFMMWAQEGSPVIATPLTLEGKPFMSVSLGQKRTSLTLALHGQWVQYWDDLGNAWDKFDVGETLFDAHLSLTEKIAGTVGTDPGESIPEAF